MTTTPAASLRRLDAAFDLAGWAGLLGLVFALGYLARFAQVPASLRLVLGEPIQMVGLLAGTTLLLRRRGLSWRDVGLRSPASAWRTAGLVLAGLFCVYGSAAAVLLLILRPLGAPAPDISAIRDLIGEPWTYVAALGLTWTTVAFGEEMAFRGFALSRLEALFAGGTPSGASWATAAACVGQGVLFGGLHGYQGVGGVFATAVLGTVLGGLFLAGRRTLAACIVVHGLIDTFALTTAFLQARHVLPQVT